MSDQRMWKAAGKLRSRSSTLKNAVQKTLLPISISEASNISIILITLAWNY
ncbi:hypothetical protein Pr1d_31680 [Bythopirellula goksoeyrii]|uniref:Uncharacterized protein n=1 Tax=Bythopirellula goksoeyrii TaxID=1400387 RepID=A0A5B9QED9_9BACT|nr:hypothetical protein Pr1d_31680 [Bythopirellula goksoeyrii]